MNIDFQNPGYLKLIKSIRRKRKCVMAVMVVSILACLPTDISFGDTVIIDKAFSPWLSVLLVLLCLFIGIVAYAAVSIPLQTAMDKDCDPEKHLVLNAALTSKTSVDNVYATDYLYLGYFTEALEYAMRMTSNANPQVSVIGWFNKARCAFMLGDTEGLHQSTLCFSNSLSDPKIPAKRAREFKKMELLLNLMCAVADNDTDRIEELRTKAETWNTSVATAGFVNYIKGVAALKADDKIEAVYRLKLVTENCSKTVFARLSAEKIESLNI